MFRTGTKLINTTFLIIIFLKHESIAIIVIEILIKNKQNQSNYY